MEKEYEDYYQMLKDENYNTLLSKEIQLNNARERALRNTNANLNAMGLASSGYGQMAQTGVEGQYLTAMEGANQTYQNTANQIKQDEYNAKIDYQNTGYQNISGVF